MSFSRRKFLQSGAVAAAAWAASPLPAWSSEHHPPAAASLPGHRPGKMPGLSRAAFTEAVGSSFQVFPGGANSQPVWLTLLAVKDLPALAPVNPASMAVPPPKTSSSVAVSGFVLTFNSSAPPLEQGTYDFQHEKLGKFALFIVPGPPGTQTYSALFNTLVSVSVAAPISPRPTPLSLGVSGGGSGSRPSNTGGSQAGSPAQEQLEPVFRNRLEPKLPE